MRYPNPGPWVAEPVNADGYVLIISQSDPEFFEYVQVAKVAPWNGSLIAAAPEMLHALQCAREFIRSGIALGYIRMPDADCPDSAHNTPGIVDAAIARATKTTDHARRDAGPAKQHGKMNTSPGSPGLPDTGDAK